MIGNGSRGGKHLGLEANPQRASLVTFSIAYGLRAKVNAYFLGLVVTKQCQLLRTDVLDVYSRCKHQLLSVFLAHHTV
jgi:GTP cyclohydrolase I